MTVSLHTFKQPKPKHMSALDGNVHFHVVCIAFPFSAALFSPAELSLRHLFFFFFYDIAVREYVVVTESGVRLFGADTG